jgi:hypothetical protein
MFVVIFAALQYNWCGAIIKVFSLPLSAFIALAAAGPVSA